VEAVELERPREALEDAGARTELISITSGEIQARENDLKDAGTFAVDRLIGAVSVGKYDGPKGYQMFKNKEDGCVRAVFRPGT